jgi:MSHA biogenesis protein MshQ
VTVPPTTTPPPAPVPPAVSPAGLVLLLHLDEAAWSGATGEVRDSSGDGHHGTAVGGATTATAGRFGRAGSFPGGAGCVAIPDVASLRPSDQLTVAAWARPDRVGGAAMGIAAKRINFQVDSAYAFFVATSGRLSVDVDTEDDRFEAGPVLTTGRWSHLAMVYDGARQATTVFLDGAAVGASAEHARSITPFRSPLWVGCLAEGAPSQGFSGLLDEVAVWHRALGTPEIAALATATAPIANP